MHIFLLLLLEHLFDLFGRLHSNEILGDLLNKGLFALLTVDLLLGDLQNLTVILIKLLVLEVHLRCLFEITVNLFPIKGLIHEILDLIHLLLVIVLLEDLLDLLRLEILVGELLSH